MGICRKAGFLGIAPLLLCVPGILSSKCQHSAVIAHGSLADAGSQIYRIHIPECESESKAPLQVTYSSGGASVIVREADRPNRDIWRNGRSTTAGEWEVTVAFDSVHCDIYCAYRRRPDSMGRTELLPPITTIQVSRDSVSKPVTVAMDPAGLGFPGLTCNPGASCPRLYLPEKKLFAADLPLNTCSNIPVSSQRAHFSTNFLAETASPTVIPLRI